MMPAVLAERCILLGSPVGATVLDPFAGAGTMGLAAIQNGRNATLIELNPEYAARIRRRLG
jgi:DNA modification methylase